MEHCAECGFEFQAVPREAVGERVRSLPTHYSEQLVTADRHELARTRPRADTWSALEYTCHVRDVFRLQRDRIHLALERDRPDFVPMRRDERAVEERYNAQDVATVLDELAAAVERFAATVDALADDQWSRTGVYHWPEPAGRSLEWVARQTLHEGLHHLDDISAGMVSLRSCLAPQSIDAAFDLFDEVWSPRIVARVNDYDVKVANVKGEYVEHAHDTDEYFHVLAGVLTIHLPEQRRTVTVGAGEVFTVPRGVRHRPSAAPGTRILMFEPHGTRNSGDATAAGSEGVAIAPPGPSRLSTLTARPTGERREGTAPRAPAP